jgi:uncharacterized protein YutE (UPF0331/DUF86 family)
MDGNLMVERINQKIGRIKEYLRLIRSMEEECRNRFQSDPIYRGALLYHLYLMVDSCLALAEMVIKYKGLRLPQTYAEAIDILGDNGILETPFAYEFARIAGFRNFIAHDYERIDALFVCEDVLSRLGDVDTFVGQIERLISR